MNVERYRRQSSKKSLRRSSSRLLSRVPVADRLFSEEDDDEQDSHGSFFNIKIERLRFPLPVQTNESLCRDEYLTKLLKPFKKVDVEITKRVSLVDDDQRKAILTAEGLAVLDMIDTARNQELDSIESDESFKMTMSPEERKHRYAICMVQFQKSAIEFLSVRLIKQLNVLVKSTSGQSKTQEVPENFFDWSVDYFIERNGSGKVNTDVIRRINSEEDLDRAKFTSNIDQVIRLVQLIINDYQFDKNMCESSIAQIKKANYDINSPWLRDSERDTLTYTALLRENRRLSSVCTHETEAKLQSQIDVMDGCLPIIQRYRRGWMHSTWDQHVLKLVSKEKALQEELQRVYKTNHEIEVATFATAHVYQYHINTLKSSIYEWDQRYEVEQYDLELNLTKMRSNLAKENEQKTFLEEQIKMFRKRVHEYLEREREAAAAMQRLEEPKPMIIHKKSKKGQRRSKSKEKAAVPSDKGEEKSLKSVNKSSEKGVKSVENSTEKGAKSVEKSKENSATSADKKTEKGSVPVDKSKEKSAKAVDKRKEKSAKSVDMTKENSAISVDKSTEKGSVLVDKGKEESVISFDKSKRESSKSVVKSKQIGAKSVAKSKKKSVISLDKSKENSENLREKSITKKSVVSHHRRKEEKHQEQLSRDKSVSRIQNLIETTSEKSNPQEIKNTTNTTKSRDKGKKISVTSRDMSKERSQRAKSIKTSISRDKSKERSATSGDKSKEKSVTSRDTSKERSKKNKSIKTTKSSDKSKETNQRAKSTTTISKDKIGESTQKSTGSLVSREKSKEGSAILRNKEEAQSSVSTVNRESKK